jgi:hypothetical protein
VNSGDAEPSKSTRIRGGGKEKRLSGLFGKIAASEGEREKSGGKRWSAFSRKVAEREKEREALGENQEGEWAV